MHCSSCTVGIAFATMRFTSIGLTDHVLIQTGETAADRVTVYGNGVTSIEYEETIKLENDTSTVQFYLPSGALTDSLTVSGIDVVKIATSEESHPIIESGDMMTVYTEVAPTRASSSVGTLCCFLRLTMEQ